MERIQKILSRYGIASRRAAEQMILDGKVTVNGKTAHLGESADIENDIITVDGKVLGNIPEHVYILLYKPRGYITSMKDERGRKTVDMLVRNCPERVYPVGRLDLNSEGLLIMTNDGDLTNRLLHPSNEIEKVYRVSVDGNDLKKADMLSSITELDGEKINPAAVTIIETLSDRMILEITIKEGKNRQIRRMCEAVGLEVRRLKRVREGFLELGKLRPGEWRYLEKSEVKSLNKSFLKWVQRAEPFAGLGGAQQKCHGQKANNRIR